MEYYKITWNLKTLEVVARRTKQKPFYYTDMFGNKVNGNLVYPKSSIGNELLKSRAQVRLVLD